VLYLPNSFLNGGWGFSTITLIIMALMTYYCSLLALEVRAKLGAKSYTECGEMTYGAYGKAAVNFSLALS